MKLPKNLLVVDVTVDPDVEKEWNDWYDRVHVPEIVTCPGFRWAARYVGEAADGSRRYLTIYEIDGPEALESEEFSKRRGWGRFKEKVNASVRTFRQILFMESE